MSIIDNDLGIFRLSASIAVLKFTTRIKNDRSVSIDLQHVRSEADLSVSPDRFCIDVQFLFSNSDYRSGVRNLIIE